MSGEDNRIAEKLRTVESGDGDRHKVDVDREQSIENRLESVGDTGGGDDGKANETRADDAPEMSIADRLATAAEYEKRVAALRANARDETAARLSNCFKQDVEVDIEQTGEESLSGVVHIPGLKSKLEEAFEGTDVEVSPIEVTVGSDSDESETPSKR